jgi:hypothetical protein
VDRQVGVVQEEVVEAARAEAEASLPSVPRLSSLTRSMLVADLKSGSGEELAMMSAVLVKRLLRPRRRLSTSCTEETVWPTSRSASAVRFIYWA